MPAIKVRVPYDDSDVYEGESLSLAIKQAVSAWLEKLDHAPEPSPFSSDVPSKTVSIWLSDSQLAVLDQVSQAHKLQSPAQACEALLHAAAIMSKPAAQAPPQSTEATTLDAINRAIGNTTRPAQERFYRQIHDALRTDPAPHKVLFAEAATGIGKTRPFIAVAIDWHREHPRDHIVIACPSYNVILQALAQWKRVAEVMQLPEYQVLLGQQEYVSQQALNRILSEDPAVPGAEAATAWLQNRGPSTADDPFGHCWLMRSLKAATGFLWTRDDDVRVTSDCSEEDEGFRAYQQQFVDAREVPVIFCTHAMLAVDVRRLSLHAAKAASAEGNAYDNDAEFKRWQQASAEDRRNAPLWAARNEHLRHYLEGDAGKLPRIDLLIVDEAHLLEQSFANMFASGVSIASLTNKMRELHVVAPRVVHQGDLDAMRTIWHDLTEFGKRAGTEVVDAKSNPRISGAINEARTLLGNIIKRVPKTLARNPHVRSIRAVVLALDVASKTMSGDQVGLRTRISYSPHRQYPSIEVGRYDVSRELDFLWAVSVRKKSILVSATLFEDVTREGLEGMRRTMSVRSNLAIPLDPVRPQWLFDPVTLHVVSAADEEEKRFLRPTAKEELGKDEFEARNEKWQREVAHYIGTAYASAAGGVLVLLTAHSDRKAIADLLIDTIPSDALIGDGEPISIEAARAKFIAASAAGRRPCLLAVGNAWTGLDISGDVLGHAIGRPIAPAEDNVLTDLIIPTSPVGLNRSLTHEWRRERLGMIAEIGATSIMFRQGIGRLVRREGLPRNRRLHFLDARIHQKEWNAVLAPIKKAISKYKTLTPYTPRTAV